MCLFKHVQKTFLQVLFDVSLGIFTVEGVECLRLTALGATLRSCHWCVRRWKVPASGHCPAALDAKV
eukprot:6208202-Pleurochrysis_carterae.AAC.1